MGLLEITHNVLDRNKRPLAYPVKTRCTELRYRRDVDEYSESRITYVPLEDTNWSYLVRTTIQEWHNEHGHDVMDDDLFVTIGITTNQILIEVSDRMKP